MFKSFALVKRILKINKFKGRQFVLITQGSLCFTSVKSRFCAVVDFIPI